MTKKLSAELERDMGQGTRDKGKWEGKAPAEPELSANREVGKSAGRKGSEW